VKRSIGVFKLLGDRNLKLSPFTQYERRGPDLWPRLAKRTHGPKSLGLGSFFERHRVLWTNCRTRSRSASVNRGGSVCTARSYSASAIPHRTQGGRPAGPTAPPQRASRCPFARPPTRRRPGCGRQPQSRQPESLRKKLARALDRVSKGLGMDENCD
jgi:hypothetical protein